MRVAAHSVHASSRRAVRIVSPRFPLLVATALVLAVCLTGGVTTAVPQAKAPVYDGATRLQFYEQHEAMKETSRFKDLEWDFIGPQVMSGRVTGIAVPNDKPWTIYVATASGGVWKTVNEGTTWEPVFDDAPSGATGALGEANIFRSSMSGTGVYKSTDDAKTWQYMGLADTHHISRILIHPTNPNIVYVAAAGKEWDHNEDRGVYKTTDGGQSWDKVLYVDEKTGAYDLRMDPRDPDTIYASMWERIRLKWQDPSPGPGTGIWKTTDGGRNWRELNEGLPATREKRGRIGIDIAASNPDVVYALIDNHEPLTVAEEGELDSYGRPRGAVIKGAEVYRSDDKGESWEKVSEASEEMTGMYSTYGWVFGQIRVDPNDENVTYLMGVPMLKSIDGGREYQRVSYTGLHGDHHAMWIDPNDSNHVINGNDGGINISYDAGRTWKNMENHPVVQFYNVAYDMREPFWVYGSIQDNGSWKAPVYLPARQLEERAKERERLLAEGADPQQLRMMMRFRPMQSSIDQWESAPGGEDSIHAIDPYDPDIVYSESFYGRIQRTINGETVSIVPEAGEGEPPLRGQWLAPFTLSPHNPKVIYHGMNFVFRSMDRGDTWEKISPDLSYNDPDKISKVTYQAIPYQTITALAESPLKFGLVYAGTDDGRLWVTRDGGENWGELTDKVVPGRWVSRVTPSAFDEGTVYVTQNGKRDSDFQAYVFMSTDYGETWKDISDGIPGGPVNVIKEDPRNPDILYVGTDLGIYVSLARSDHSPARRCVGHRNPWPWDVCHGRASDPGGCPVGRLWARSLERAN